MSQNKMNGASFASLMKGFIGKKEKEKKQNIEENVRLRSIALISKVIKEADDDGDDEGGWREKMAQTAERPRKSLPGYEVGKKPGSEVQNVLSQEMTDAKTAQEESINASISDLEAKEAAKRSGKVGITTGEKNALFKAWLGTRSPEKKEEIRKALTRMSPEEKFNWQKNIVNKLMLDRGLKGSRFSYNLAQAQIRPEQSASIDPFVKKILMTFLKQREAGINDPNVQAFIRDAFPDLKKPLGQLKGVPLESAKAQEILGPLIDDAALHIDAKFWNSRLDAYKHSDVDRIADIARRANQDLGKLSKYGADASNPQVDVGREKIVNILGRIPDSELLALYAYYRANKNEVIRANMASVRTGVELPSRGGEDAKPSNTMQGNPNAITSKRPLIGSEEEGSFVPGRYASKLAKTGELSDKEWREVAAAAIDPESGAQSKHLFDKLIETMTRQKETRDGRPNPAYGAAPNEIKRILTLAIARNQMGAFKNMKSFDEIKDKLHPEEHALAQEVIKQLDPTNIISAKDPIDLRAPFKDLATEEGEKIAPGGHVEKLHSAQKAAKQEKRIAGREEAAKARQLKFRRMDPRDIEAGRQAAIRRRRETQHASVERARKLRSAAGSGDAQDLKPTEERRREMRSRDQIRDAKAELINFELKNPKFAQFMDKAREALPRKQAEEVIKNKAAELGLKLPAKIPQEYRFSAPDLTSVHRGEGRLGSEKRDLFASLSPEELEGKELGAKYRRRLAGVSPEDEAKSRADTGRGDKLKQLINATGKKMKEAGMKVDRKTILQVLLGMIEQGKLPDTTKAEIVKKLGAIHPRSGTSTSSGGFSGLKKAREKSGPVQKAEPDIKAPGKHLSNLDSGLSGTSRKLGTEKKPNIGPRKEPEGSAEDRKVSEPPHSGSTFAKKVGGSPASKIQSSAKEKIESERKAAKEREETRNKARFEKKKAKKEERGAEKKKKKDPSLSEMIFGPNGKQVKFVEKEKPWETCKPIKKYMSKMTLKEIFDITEQTENSRDKK